jgi:hypothetical protein
LLLLSPGKSHRLKKRFAALDADVNRRLGVFAFAALVVMALLVLLPERLGSPEWLSRALGVAFGVGIVPAFAFFYFRTSQELSLRHDLQCSHCGRALRKLFLRMRRPADPDYCVDGGVPVRCPHCHAPIESATDKRAPSN